MYFDIQWIFLIQTDHTFPQQMICDNITIFSYYPLIKKDHCLKNFIEISWRVLLQLYLQTIQSRLFMQTMTTTKLNKKFKLNPTKTKVDLWFIISYTNVGGGLCSHFPEVKIHLPSTKSGLLFLCLKLVLIHLSQCRNSQSWSDHP